MTFQLKLWNYVCLHWLISLFGAKIIQIIKIRAWKTQAGILRKKLGTTLRSWMYHSIHCLGDLCYWTRKLPMRHNLKVTIGARPNWPGFSFPTGVKQPFCCMRFSRVCPFSLQRRFEKGLISDWRSELSVQSARYLYFIINVCFIQCRRSW